MGWLDFLSNRKRSPRVEEIPPPPPPDLPPEFPYPLIGLQGKDALEWIDRLRREAQQSKAWPVLLGSKAEVEELVDQWPRGIPSMAVTLSEARRLRLEQCLEARLEQHPELRHRLSSVDPWPKVPSSMPHLQSHLEPETRQIKRRVFIAQVPVAEGWHLPLALGLDGADGTPSAIEKAVFARSWLEVYGAEIIAATSRSMEFYVTRPPAAPQECIKLAHEIYHFCPNQVDGASGASSLTHLAANLQGSPFWFFRW